MGIKRGFLPGFFLLIIVNNEISVIFELHIEKELFHFNIHLISLDSGPLAL